MSSKKRISKRPGSRWAAGLAVLCALAFAAPPVTAGPWHDENGHRRGNSERAHRWKHDRSWGHRGWKREVAPRTRYDDDQRNHSFWGGRRDHHWFFPWHRSERVVYYGDRPFYFHGDLGVFFDGGAFSIRVSEAPPLGYLYHDPYCDLPIASVASYHSHLRYHHHPALVEVVWVGR